MLRFFRMLHLHVTHELRALALGFFVAAGCVIVGCSGEIETSAAGGATSGTGNTSGTAGATTGTGGNGSGAGGTGSSGSMTTGGGGSSGTAGGNGPAGGAGQGGTGQSGSGQGGRGGSNATGGSSGGGGAMRDSGIVIPDAALADRGAGADTGPGCHGALTGPPDYSGDNAGTQVPGADANQMAALVRANHWRTANGLTPLNANALIQRASVAHAHFMTINPSTCYPGAHDEVVTCAMFTGAGPAERMTAAGYRWQTAAEVIDSAADGTTAVDEWIWTVYHRTPFLDAQYLDVGFALEGMHAVMDFGTLSSAQPGSTTRQAVFPIPGQTGVKVDFDGRNEGPMPLPPASKGWPSGTVISVSFSKDYVMVSHALYDDACQPVVHTSHGSFDGDMFAGNRFLYMFADAPLAHGKTYTASVSAVVGGTPWSETWSFTTQ